MVPIDAAEFEARKNINAVIIQFLCHNKGKGFSAKEIADVLGIKEDEVNHAMVKLSFTELFSNITAGLISKKSDRHDRKPIMSKIEDITINGLIYYRCVEYTLE
jgi:DNA-directed RNA polymerase specialized sigma subunit